MSYSHSQSHSHSHDDGSKKLDAKAKGHDGKKEPKKGGHSSTKDYNYGWFNEDDPAADLDDFDNMKLKKAIGDHISNKGFGNTRG